MLIYKALIALSRPRSFAYRVRKKLARMCGSNSRPIPQDFIQKYAAGKTFADIGCMWGINGALSFSAERSGAKRVTAVDIYPATDEFKDAHSRCNSRINFVHGDINETETLKAVGKSEVVFCAGVLYHTPDPFSLLVRLRSICDETLILGTQIIPEIPGLRNTAIFYPMLDEARRKLFNIRIGMQKSVTGPYEPESGYGNWFWGMTSSCVESLLVCAGFAVLEKYLEPFHGWFICRVAERKFAWVSGEYITREDPRFTQYL